MAENMDYEDLGRQVADVSISYSVREILTRIEEKLITQDERSRSYVTKADLDKVFGEFSQLERDVTVQITDIRKEVRELHAIRDRLIGFLIAIMVIGSLSGAGAGLFVSNVLGG